jgi:SNF2 family DNA or RNA helicase
MVKTHGTLVYGRNVWGLRALPYVMIKAKRIFPRGNPASGGTLVLSDTPEVARDLEWLLTRYPLEIKATDRDLLSVRAAEHRDTEQLVHEILTGQRVLDAHGLEVSAEREHRDYQYVAADLAIATGRLLLTDELGLGKTMSALLVLRAARALPALVVCQTHLPAQWAREIRATYPGLRVHIVKQMRPYDPAQRRGSTGPPDVLIVPYSKLRGWSDALAGKVRTVIFDEAQELRRGASQKWWAAQHVAETATYRVGLTATPVYNYAGEIHTLYEVLAPGVLGNRDEFIREWSGSRVRTIGGDDHVAVADPAALGVYLREEGLMLRRTRADVGRELPAVVHVPHEIDTDEEALDALIAETVDLAELIVSGGDVEPAELPENVTSLAAYRAAQNRAVWVARGDLDWRLRRATGLAKAPYVAEFVKLLLESDEQVVLFGWHRDVYDVWLSRLAPYDPALYTGSESPSRKAANAAEFIDGSSRVLIMSLRSGVGLDGLQEVSHLAVFGELDWAPGTHEQCIGRLQRDGQADPVVAYFLLSEGGTDPLMAEVLNLKRGQSEPLLNPDQPLLAPAVDNRDRILELARDVLARRRAKQPSLG